MNLYEILGLNKDASLQAIKKAYRSLSNTHHPDKGGDPNKFRELVMAYNILFDPEKRSRYDNGESVEAINKSLADIQNEVFGNLTAIFIHAVSNTDPNHQDIAALMKRTIDEGQINIQNQIATQKKVIERFTSASKRMKSTREENFFSSVSNTQITNAEAAIKTLERQVQIGKEMKTFLEAYSYQHDPLVQHYTFTINGVSV